MPNCPFPSRRDAIAGALAAAACAQATPTYAQADAMKSLIAAAKAEGTVSVDGPPIDTVRDMLTQDFQKAYGITVSYVGTSGGASSARVRSERAAGKYLLDVLVAGGDTPTNAYLPSGWLDKVEPILIAPDVVDKRNWKDGHLWYEDPGNTILRVLRFVTPELAINTRLVKPGEITTWKSLLEPKWQGRIIAKDPSVPGAGTSLVALLYLTFGPDYVKRLYRDQKPVISREGRQAAQFLAQGAQPILVGPETVSVDQFKHLGYPVEYVFPTDAPDVLSGGYGLISLVNKAPHPNAAKLYINWLAGRAAQKKFAEVLLSESLRNDITYQGLPSWVFTHKGGKYLDTYDYKFVTEQRDSSLTKAREMLGL